MTSHQRRHVRVAGPFDGWRIGFVNTAVRVYDLSDGGCFLETSDEAPAPGAHLVLKIDVPHQGWIYLKGETVYVKPNVGFAVSFVDVPAESSDRLQRGLLQLRGVLPESEQDQALMLPVCPRCRATSARPLGMAASTLPWFTCGACEHVWAARELPRIDDIALPHDARPATSRHQGSKQILIADDDGGVLGVLEEGLSGYRVLTARDVAEAWTLGHSVSLDLLITDYLMPDGTGEELITKLRHTHPALKVIVLTGHQQMLDDEGYSWWKTERHLGKPCTIAEIRATVMELIGSP
jgi:two-component system cell cycle response regulator CpdR